MAARKSKAARKAGAVKSAPAARVAAPATSTRVAALRARAAVERHGGTALELRLQAVELLLASLTG